MAHHDFAVAISGYAGFACTRLAMAFDADHGIYFVCGHLAEYSAEYAECAGGGCVAGVGRAARAGGDAIGARERRIYIGGGRMGG
jgi:hypothetical protein